MGKTYRNKDYTLFGGIGDGKDGSTLSSKESYRQYKEMRRRKDRRKEKQLMREGKDIPVSKKDGKYWW
jgi:hypothetical protein